MINFKAFLISMWLVSLPMTVDISNSKQRVSRANVQPEKKNVIETSSKKDFSNISEAFVYMLLNFTQ
jgi:hypothetical protein